MKKKKYIVLTFVCAVFFCILFAKAQVNAASASVIITTGNTDIKKGDRFTVVVIAESSAIIGDFEAYISYDQKLMEFDTGGNYVTEEEGGILHILEMGSGNNVAVKKYSLQFYAKKNGKCEIAVKDRPVALEADTGEEMSVSKNSLSLVVGQEEKPLSNNKNLGSLSISNGTLKPEFSRKKTEYKVTVGSDVNTLFVMAKPADKKASVLVSGNEKLKTGVNTVTVEVTSQAGEVKEYILKVKKLSPEEEALEEEEDPEEELAAAGEDMVAYMDGGKTYLSHTYKYEVVSLDDSSQIPAGYAETSLVLGGKSVTAYTLKNDLDNDFLLLYLKYQEENPQFYLYDRKEKSIQRYQMTQKKVVETDNTQTAAENEYQGNLFQLTIVIAVETALCAMLLAAVIRLYLKCRKKEQEDEFDI